MRSLAGPFFVRRATQETDVFAAALLFLSVPFDVFVGQFREGLGPSRVDLLRHGIAAVVRLAHDIAGLLSRVGQADARIGTDREPTQASGGSVADDEGTVTTWREARTESWHGAVPAVVAVRGRGDQRA